MSGKLTEDMAPRVNENYLSFARELVRKSVPIFVDDTEVIKPYGKVAAYCDCPKEAA